MTEPLGVDAPEFLKRFATLKHQRDLIEYQGPILAEMASIDDRFLLLWSGRVDFETHRWLAYQVSERSLAQYVAGEVTQRAMILATPIVFLIDIDGVGGDFRPVRARQVLSSELTEDYLPDVASFMPGTSDARSY